MRPIPYKVWRMPIRDLCRVCPCADPRGFLEELAALPEMPHFPMVESQSVEEAQRWAAENEEAFRAALDGSSDS